MVRLKEITFKEGENDLIIFQFLMVRLKDYQDRLTFQKRMYFNSLWCD
mgnify:CR=1 FL=1